MCHQCVTISPRSSDTKTDRVFVAGDHVYLEGARGFGLPGVVQKMERGKVIVLWGDLNICTRHRPKCLVLAASMKRDEAR